MAIQENSGHQEQNNNKTATLLPSSFLFRPGIFSLGYESATERFQFGYCRGVSQEKESAAARIAEDYHSIIDNDHDNGV